MVVWSQVESRALVIGLGAPKGIEKGLRQTDSDSRARGIRIVSTFSAISTAHLKASDFKNISNK